MHKLHGVLLGVSVLPALLIVPAVADPVQVGDWITLRDGLINSGTSAMELAGNITAGAFDSGVEVYDGFYVIGDKTVDLNGFTLDGNSVNRQISIRNDNTVTLTGGGTISNLNYTTGDSSNSQAGSIFVAVRSTLALEDGDYTFSDNQSRFGVINVNNNHTDGTTSFITNNVGTLTFDGNTSTDQGGALYATGSATKPTQIALNADKIVFNNNSVTEETKTGHGGAIMNMSTNATLSADVIEFTDNKVLANTEDLLTDVVKSGGGAIQNAYSGDLTVGKAGGTVLFGHNSSTTNGGALLNRGDSQTKFLGSVEFDDNHADINGGAIYNTSSVAQTLSNATFTNNTADGKGGAIYNEGTMTLANTTFGGVDVQTGDSVGNSATEGGSIFNKGTLTFSDATTFANNTASNSGDAFGGAVANYYGDLTFNGLATFNNNSVTSTGGAAQGGALHNLSATTTFNNGATFSGNTASSGAAIYNGLNYQRAGIVNINGDSLFENNTASNGNGIVFNVSNADVDNTIAFADGDATFRGNTGVALWNQDLVTFTSMGDVLFENNTNTAQSGSNAAISNGGTMTINADTFTVQNNTSSKGAVGNTSPSSVFTVNAVDSILFDNNTGGAIYKENDNLTLTAGNSITFSGNHGGVAGPALNNNGNYSKTTLSANAIEFSDNVSTSSYGGAIFNSGDYVKILGANNTFSGNRAESTTNTVKYGGGAISNRGNAASTQTTTIEIGLANGSSENTFTNNYSGAHGGAIHARAEAASDEGAVTILGATEFSGNKARLNGGAISNSPVLGLSTVTLTGSGAFENNFAGNLGGAVYNTGVASINATTGNFTFSGNKSGVTFDNEGNVVADTGTANDVYNAGSLTLNAGADRMISLAGGIDGETNGSTTGLLNVTGTGTVSIANVLKNQTVSVADGSELHLTDADLTGSSITVASGATLNSIDNLVNNYVGKITLNDGALFGLDIDFNNNLFDTYTIADAATVTLSKVNLLSALTGNVEAKDLQIAELGNINISSAAADSVKAYTSTAVFGLVGNNANNGTISLAQIDTVASGTGLSLAAADSVNQEQSYYQVTADESVTTDQNLVNEFAVVGSGTTDGDAGVALDATFAVADDSTFTAENIKLEGTGSIDTAADAEFAATNAKVGVDVNNEGNTTFTGTTFTAGNTFTNAVGATATMMNSDVYGTFLNSGIVYSDPTTYYGLFDNAGTATFEGDTFETAAVLNNTGVANFAKDGDDNEVTFVSGATITGDGLINLLSGTTHFNNTASSNTIKLASGAKFDGTLASTGVVDTRNNNIDTGLGTVTGGDLYVDANLVAGTTDEFADTTGAIIRGISLANAGYGTSDSVTLDFGGATLDSNAEIDGMNYYTQITQSGSSVTFSDKLINESNLYSKLGSWTGGYYIKSNVDMTNAADADHLTVGQALQALDTAVNGKQATIVDSATIAANGTGGFDVVAGSIGATQLAANSVASSNIIDGTIVNADIATGTITTDRLANQGVAQFSNDANYQNADQVSNAITTALANGTNAYQTANDVTTTLGAYSTTAQMNAAIAAATTMGDDGDAGTSMYNNFADGVSVTSAVASLDAAIGTTTNGTYVSASNNVGTNINALDTALATVAGNITAATTAIGTTTDGTHVLAANSIGANLNALDTALATAEGTISAHTTAIGTTANGTHVLAANSIGANLNVLDSAIGATTDGTHVLAANNVGTNINALDTALATAEGNITANATAIATLNGAEDVAGSVRNIAKAYAEANIQGAYSYADKLVDNLNEDLSAGIASAVALSSVAVSDVRRGEMSVGAGYGYFNGQSAAAFGAAMGISNRWSVNAGAGVSGYDVSFRAGTNYKFKLF